MKFLTNFFCQGRNGKRKKKRKKITLHTVVIATAILFELLESIGKISVFIYLVPSPTQPTYWRVKGFPSTKWSFFHPGWLFKGYLVGQSSTLTS